MKRDILEAQAWLRPFPERDGLFAEEQAWLPKHFHALALIDLGAMEGMGRGWLPFLSPIEPYDGYPGDFAVDSEDPFAGPNWLSFRLRPDDRLEFLGNRAWFALEQTPARQLTEAVETELRRHYAEQERSFEGARIRFERYGGLYRGARFNPKERASDDEEPSALILQWGGPVGSSNWSGWPDPPAAYRLDQSDDDDVFPTLADGTRFFHIASVPGWHWRSCGADLILLFFEPRSRTVVMTFDWT